MQSSNILSVDLTVLNNNLKKLCSSFKHVMVMVKANAYGTDPIFLAKFIQQQSWTQHIPYLGVSHVWEGIQLREAGIHLPIFVIAAPAYEAEAIVDYNLCPAISTIEEVDALNVAAKKKDKRLFVHLHLNTGMSRFGAPTEAAYAIYKSIDETTHLSVEGIMTHFVAAESETFDAFTREQIALFEHFLYSLPQQPRWIHAANSAGAVRFAMPFCNLVRIGLGLMGYGICLDGVKPVFKLTTKLASISLNKKGETVGYNRTYTIQSDKARIGVLPLGYYDGFHRSLSGKGYVLIRGKKAPMIGTICMDFMMVDLTNIPESQVGDEVILFGTDLSPDTVATWANTDVRELLVSLPHRVKRLWNGLPRSIIRTDDDTSTERLPSSFFTIKKDPPSR